MAPQSPALSGNSFTSVLLITIVLLLLLILILLLPPTNWQCSGKSVLLFLFRRSVAFDSRRSALFPSPALPVILLSLPHSWRQVALVAPSNGYLLRLRIVSGVSCFVSAGILCIFIYFLLPVLWFLAFFLRILFCLSTFLFLFAVCPFICLQCNYTG